jgi:DNA-directed RNA polymerase subunit H (RpoH/RPB5)
MRYFNSLPNVVSTDSSGNSVLLKNLLIRTELLPKLSTNPLIFYKYSIQDGDTPEIIADKYYGDSYRYWLVLYANPQIQDPQWDWPLDSNEFTTFLQDKYSEAAGGVANVLSYTQGTVYQYEKIVTTIDNSSGTTAVKNVVVDYNTYSMITQSTTTQKFPDGSSVTYTISSKATSIYDYEVSVNEAKRDINIINSVYATELETQYQALVNQ